MEHFILLWLNNDQATHELCTGVAMDAATLTVQGDTSSPDHEVHHAAGEAVSGQLIDWIERIGERAGHEGRHDGPAATMLGMFRDLLDVGDSQLWSSIGGSFLSDWTRPAVCAASDCAELATEGDAHCDDCAWLQEHRHSGVGGMMAVHDEDLESVAAVRVVECSGCDMIYVAGQGWMNLSDS